MKKIVDGVVVDMTPEDEKKMAEMMKNPLHAPPSQEVRIAELETRLTRYEENEKATNILLGVTE